MRLATHGNGHRSFCKMPGQTEKKKNVPDIEGQTDFEFVYWKTNLLSRRGGSGCVKPIWKILAYVKI